LEGRLGFRLITFLRCLVAPKIAARNLDECRRLFCERRLFSYSNRGAAAEKILMDVDGDLWLLLLSSRKESPLARNSVSEQPALARSARSRARWHLGMASIALALACAVCLCWVFRRPLFQGNRGVVDSGRVFRSAQPTTELDRLIRDYQLKSILNLRAGSQADWWYEAEVSTAEANGLAFYDLPLSASRRPRRHELLKLIDVFDDCPYPLLIHCKSGADRTGLASAVYCLVRRREAPERARLAFSAEFGHIPYGGSEHLHEPIDEYAAWLKSHQLPHAPERFRGWVKNEYSDEDPSTDPPHLQPGARVRRADVSARVR
jgi:protein tyrosine phosphatase (PTP) superfamily phosphohydrolase (DUF442 family)